MRWDIQVPFTENNNLIVFFDPTAKNPAAGNRLGAATQFGNCPGCAGFDRADIHWGHFGPRLGFAYQVNPKTVVQAGFSVAFLNGGAYEYGTSKTAVNYGNLLVGSFTRLSGGTNSPAYGSWDKTNCPIRSRRPSIQVSALAHRSTTSAKTMDSRHIASSGMSTCSVSCHGIFSCKRHGSAIVSFTCPVRLNAPNQLDPKYLRVG